MISWIDKEYCHDNVVEVETRRNSIDIIISPEELMYLEGKNAVIISKQANTLINRHSKHLDRESSEENTVERTEKNLRYKKHVYEYNKLYLSFSTYGGIGCGIKYFFKGRDRALYLNYGFSLDERNCKKEEKILTRKETEEIFDSSKYDSMYIIDLNSGLIFADNKIDGKVINNKIIPSDEEIIELEKSKRISDYELSCMFNSANKSDEKYQEASKSKSIDEIKNIKIYGSILFNNYAHLLVTTRDGKFEVKWFSLNFLEEDKFILNTAIIPIKEPAIEDIIEYSRNNEIKPYDVDPYATMLEKVRTEIEKQKNIPNEETQDKFGTTVKKKIKKIFNI